MRLPRNFVNYLLLSAVLTLLGLGMLYPIGLTLRAVVRELSARRSSTETAPAALPE